MPDTTLLARSISYPLPILKSILFLIFTNPIFILYFLIFFLIPSHLSPVLAQPIITKPILSFCAGYAHACALFDNNSVKCWGRKQSFGISLSSFDGLGDSTNELGDSIPYINLDTSLTPLKVSCSLHTCVLFDVNKIKCIGENLDGQIGIDSSLSVIGEVTGHVGEKLPFANVGTDIKVVDVVVGQSHTCIKIVNNKVKCFGKNDKGQLGLGSSLSYGSSVNRAGDNLPYTDLGTNIQVLSLHSGPAADHNCAIIFAPTESADRIKCWGYGAFSQLGYDINGNMGDTGNKIGDRLPLVDLGTESRVKQLALGSYHTCAVLVSEVLKCWGYALQGQLGSGSTKTLSEFGNKLPAVVIDANSTIKYIGAGYGHTCIVYEDSTTLKCVGRNGDGQLGQGDIINKGNDVTTTFPFVRRARLSSVNATIASLNVGFVFNCVVLIDNSVKCFGNNAYGQCAIGTTNNVGDSQYEMEDYLRSAILFSPPLSPVRQAFINAILFLTYFFAVLTCANLILCYRNRSRAANDIRDAELVEIS